MNIYLNVLSFLSIEFAQVFEKEFQNSLGKTGPIDYFSMPTLDTIEFYLPTIP